MCTMLSKKRKISTTDENVVEDQEGWGNSGNNDILLRIFEKYLTRTELTSGVAHVCRAWRVACCDPILWSTLNLMQLSSTFNDIPPEKVNDSDEDGDTEDNLTKFLKLAMSLSKKNVKTLILPHSLNLSDEMLRYTTKRCPNLKRLVVPSWRFVGPFRIYLDDSGINETGLCDALRYCKKLECLTLPSSLNPHNIFLSIRENCKKFRELKVMGRIQLFFVENLVQHLPKLKVLSLRCTAIQEDALIKILEKMKELEVLNIAHSYLLVTTDELLERETILRDLDKTIIEKAAKRKLKLFVTCMEYRTCEMCQRTERVQGMSLSCKYEEGLWQEDEISSLRF